MMGFVLSLVLGTLGGWGVARYLKALKVKQFDAHLTFLREQEESRLKKRLDKRQQKQQQHLETRHQEARRRFQKDRNKWEERKGRFKHRKKEVDREHSALDRRASQNRHVQKAVAQKRSQLKSLAEELQNLQGEQRQVIQSQLDLNGQDLREEHLRNYEQEVMHECQSSLRRFVSSVEDSREELAESFIDLLINRLQLKPTVKPQENRFTVKKGSFAARTFVDGSPVVGKIQELCQVEFQFPEDSDQVIISAFDGVARERAMRLTDQVIRERLTDPEKIEDKLNHVARRHDREMTRAAGDLLRRLKIDGVPVEVVRLQGRIRHRTSFGQNVLDHQLEVGFLCGMLAMELPGFDFKTLRQCGFFHDIGKAIDVVQEGSHPELGGDFLKQYETPEKVVHAAYKHHDPFDAENLETAITTACDAMSASRPGARRESIDNYVERVESLEKLAREPAGISAVAVVHAGREIQVSVNAEKISDKELQDIGNNIAERIEEELVYPGEIRVHVVRETNVRVVAQ